MKRHLFTALAVAATLAAPALYAQTTTTTTRPMPVAGTHMTRHQGPRGHNNKMMADLNLTGAQQAQVKAIHAKYEPQIKAEREKMRPQMEAARAARAKGDTSAVRANRANARGATGPMQQIHQQEMAEVRAILTPAQQQKFDTMKTRGDHMKGGKMMGDSARRSGR
ncbi:MAG: Spy/CpxP family protein refolding chaperone [Gemmatimonadaceae bacterium]